MYVHKKEVRFCNLCNSVWARQIEPGSEIKMIETSLFGQQLVLEYFIVQNIVHYISNLKQFVMVYCTDQLCGQWTTRKMELLINNKCYYNN